jgi:long-chain acyl-CoA synthetase
LNAEKEFRAACSAVRILNLGSATTPIRNQEKLVELLPNTRLFISYATTETSTVSRYEFGKYGVSRYCIGTPAEAVKLNVLDDEGNPLEHSDFDNPGILAVESPANMVGYWESADSKLSCERLPLTDVGYKDGNGLYYLLGRKDDVINSGGRKISPGEIEEAVLEIESIRECACVSVPDAIMGEVPKLYVVMKEDFVFSAKEIVDFLNNKLESYKLPRTILEVPELPKVGIAQKINRHILRQTQ